MSELEKLLRSKGQVPLKEIPFPKKKCLGIEITESITDAEILAVVSALIKAKDSAEIKHSSICIQKHEKQELEFSLSIKCPQIMVEKGIQGLLSNLVQCQVTLNSSEDKELDFYQVINREEVDRLARPSGRSFAQAVGILIGAECNSIFDLKKYTESRAIKKEIDNLVSIIGIESYSLLSKEIDKFVDTHSFIKEVISHASDKLLFSYNEKLEQVVNSNLVIGPPSFYTNAAACLEIPCIEIFDSQEQLNVYSKWSSFKYAAVLKDEAEYFKASRLETAWKHWSGENVTKQVDILIPADG